jgi:rubrerythrin
MLAYANRCGVCGWRGEGESCQRCGTVLLRDLAFCPRCGKAFDGPIAWCDACGGAVTPPRTPEASEAIGRLARIPGVDEEAAKRLFARGFKDPADLFRLALPERAVRQGLHRVLARKIALGDLTPARRVRKSIACPRCGTSHEAYASHCPICGTRGEWEVRPDEVERNLAEVVGEVYDLMGDPDFGGMPEEMREEILDAFEGAGLATAVDNEYEVQFREWRARGLETHELERILREEGSDAFRAKFVRIIRTQIMKRRVAGRFVCPLCDLDLAPAVEECENCGAKFG